MDRDRWGAGGHNVGLQVKGLHIAREHPSKYGMRILGRLNPLGI
jgi:hypothetical protein